MQPWTLIFIYISMVMVCTCEKGDAQTMIQTRALCIGIVYQSSSRMYACNIIVYCSVRINVCFSIKGCLIWVLFWRGWQVSSHTKVALSLLSLYSSLFILLSFHLHFSLSHSLSYLKCMIPTIIVQFFHSQDEPSLW